MEAMKTRRPSASTIASYLSLAISVLTIAVTYQMNVTMQNRQIQNDRIDKFSNSSTSLMEAAAVFVSAMNAAADLKPARDKFAAAIGQQIIASNDLKVVSGANSEKLFSDYQNALLELSRTVQRVSNPTEMRPWAESFGRALDARASLTRQLQSQIGIRS
jgi:hypothetical protein